MTRPLTGAAFSFAGASLASPLGGPIHVQCRNQYPQRQGARGVGGAAFHGPRRRTRTARRQALGRQLPLRPSRRLRRTLPPHSDQMHPVQAPAFLRLHHLLQPRPLHPRPTRLHRRVCHPRRRLVHPPHPSHQTPVGPGPLPPPDQIQIRKIPGSLAPAAALTTELCHSETKIGIRLSPRTTTAHVGTAALGCPVERSSTSVVTPILQSSCHSERSEEPAFRRRSPHPHAPTTDSPVVERRFCAASRRTEKG